MGPRRVSVIIPSTRRVERLVECVERLWATVRGWEVECLVVTDDVKTGQRMKADKRVRVVDLPENAEVWRPRALEAWNLGASLAMGDVLVLGADDLWWFHGWIGEAMEQMASFPGGDGMVGLNDLAHDGNMLCTHFAVSRRFAVEHLGGVLVCPRYHHYYVDQEAAERAKRAKRFIWAQNAVVEHLHPAFGKAPPDALYERTKAWLDEDGDLFRRRAAAGWPDDFEPALRTVGDV
jgi:glycosyltransferase involved in cell wall biosynthesis